MYKNFKEVKKKLGSYDPTKENHETLARKICRLFLKSADNPDGYEPKSLFRMGDFILHSGNRSSWKIDCNALTDADWKTLALMVAERFSFGQVVGIPTGGLNLARALERYVSTGATLIVDDVLTTGKSMKEERTKHTGEVIGVVVFARGAYPDWIHPLFQLYEPKHCDHIFERTDLLNRKCLDCGLEQVREEDAWLDDLRGYSAWHGKQGNEPKPDETFTEQDIIPVPDTEKEREALGWRRIPDEGSRWLTLMEIKDIALLYCSPETRPTDISIDEYVIHALRAQEAKTASIKDTFWRAVCADAVKSKDAEVAYWREKCWNDTMSAKKSGYDDAQIECQARVDKLIKEIETHDLISNVGLTDIEELNWWQAIKKREGL